MHLKEVYRRLKLANLVINSEKCKFAQRSIKYLGHVITDEGIGTDPDKVSAITRISAPKCIRELRQFLGAASWYRRLIKDFSKMVAPLTKLLKKTTRWQWNSEQQKAFDELKLRLTSTPALKAPDFSKQFIFKTEGSDVGLGVALVQQEEGNDHVIACASRTLSPPERNYSVTEKECLAIVRGSKKCARILKDIISR